MQVKEFIEKTGFEVISDTSGIENEVNGVFVGDLLSYVMGHSEEKQAWITVQSHLNVLAVSALKEISCVVFVQGVSVSQEMLDKAKEENIPLCTTSLSAYEACKKCAQIGL